VSSILLNLFIYLLFIYYLFIIYFSFDSFYNSLALQTLLYGSENWTVKARDARRMTVEEMKSMRGTAGHTWTDHKTNTETATELNITPVLDKIQDYKRSWIKHINRMPRNRLPRIIKSYATKGRRNQGRPL
jgi:hypothetical protein